MAENNILELHERLNRLWEQRNDSGGNPPGSDMEARIAKLEANVEHIHTDISDIKKDLRWLLGGGIGAFVITWAGLIAVALGLAYLMAKGFKWL